MTKEGHGADSGGDQANHHPRLLSCQTATHPSLEEDIGQQQLVNGQSSGVAKADIVGFFFYSAGEYMTRWERMESTSGQ